MFSTKRQKCHHFDDMGIYSSSVVIQVGKKAISLIWLVLERIIGGTTNIFHSDAALILVKRTIIIMNFLDRLPSSH